MTALQGTPAPDVINLPVVIVGGGLAGLMVARSLHRLGITFLLLEARTRLGGRILSTDASGSESADGFDLGPSWFWPGMQPAMAALVGELGLTSFPQQDDGDVIFQRMSRETPRRYRGLRQEPQSMRLVGGMSALVAAIASRLPKEQLRLGARVTQVGQVGQAVQITFVEADGTVRRMEAAHVVFALPPRLLESAVSFSPALGAAMARRWRETPTWMAPHAKFFALYDRPFWRDLGLSGTAQSMVGPLVEIHDATTASGRAALFGFVGVPAERRAAQGREAITAASIAQLVHLFGPEAGLPSATLFKDWAADPLTATAEDPLTGGHPQVDERPWVDDLWQAFLSLAGSETSTSEPGYLAGAVAAAERAVREVVEKSGRPAPASEP